MDTRTSTAKRRTLTASGMVSALASDLSLVKSQDGLTLNDMARILGKSTDRVGKYLAGEGTMDVVTFGLAKHQWNGRFTGSFDRLIGESRGDTTSDRAKGTCVLKAALALSEALEGDDHIDGREVHSNRKIIEDARDALTALLGKLELRAA